MKENEYIAGIWSGHDCSYFIMDHKGQPVVHNELERFNREKEPKGNSFKFLKENFEEYKNIKYLATCWPFHADKIYHGAETDSLEEKNEITYKSLVKEVEELGAISEEYYKNKKTILHLLGVV